MDAVGPPIARRQDTRAALSYGSPDRLPAGAVGRGLGEVGTHRVAGLPSTAATGPLPGIQELAVAEWQRAKSLVGCSPGCSPDVEWRW